MIATVATALDVVMGLVKTRRLAAMQELQRANDKTGQAYFIILKSCGGFAAERGWVGCLRSVV